MGVNLEEDMSVRVARASPSFQSGDQPIDSEGLNAKRVIDRSTYINDKFIKVDIDVLKVVYSRPRSINWGLRSLSRVICEHSKTLLNSSNSLQRGY